MGISRNALVVVLIAFGWCSGRPAVCSQTPDQKLPAKTRTIVDLSTEELRRMYGEELRDLLFDDNQQGLGVFLSKAGDNVQSSFRNIPNTASKEEILFQRLRPGGRIEASAGLTYNYLLLTRPGVEGVSLQEDRTDRRNRPVTFERMSEYMVTAGFAGHCVFLDPSHQYSSRFRSLGRQTSEPHAQVIAFAQKPEAGDFLTFINGVRPTPVLLQGIVWIDPATYQIVRMRTDLLRPDYLNQVTRQTTEIWLTEVHFTGAPQSFWLPREVVVTIEFRTMIYRNVHKYSDYKLFTVSSFDKIVKP